MRNVYTMSREELTEEVIKLRDLLLQVRIQNGLVISRLRNQETAQKSELQTAINLWSRVNEAIQ